MFTIPELFSVGALPYTAPAAVVFLVSLFILLRSRPGSPDPSCGKCGYGVRGLPTLRCPECGSDLKEVGIRPGAKRIPHPLWLRTIALTFALGLPAAALLKPGLALAPSYWTGHAVTGLHRRPPGGIGRSSSTESSPATAGASPKFPIGARSNWSSATGKMTTSN